MRDAYGNEYDVEDVLDEEELAEYRRAHPPRRFYVGEREDQE